MHKIALDPFQIIKTLKKSISTHYFFKLLITSIVSFNAPLNRCEQVLRVSVVLLCPKKDETTGEVIETEIVTKNEIIYKNIIDYLNLRLGTNYKSSSAKTRSLIDARLNDGFTEDDFKVVIDKKYDEWRDNEMSQYLRPETLFSNKFESYLNQKLNTT